MGYVVVFHGFFMGFPGFFIGFSLGFLRFKIRKNLLLLFRRMVPSSWPVGRLLGEAL